MTELKRFYCGMKGVVVHKDSVLLLEKEFNDESFWEAPGGRVNEGELSKEALIRELKEELIGISDIEVHEQLGADVLDSVLLDEGIGLVLIYSRVSISSKDFKLSGEHTGLRWISNPEDIPKNVNSPVLEKIVRDILE